ncbi:hypothetical protein XCM_3405 [Xanthomonas citri pv. mangiferaeindicae]|nr:hypothetical protein XCM_3405 [Xanthomonas citri pv. mangiferaeindicae]
MGDALWRHRPLGRFVGRTRTVIEAQLFALQHAGGHGAEAGFVQLAATMWNDPHPIHRPLRDAGLGSQQSFDALLQRCQHRGQHPAAGAREQLLRGQQRVQFFRTQPQAGQFEAVAFAGEIAKARFAIAFHRRHQRVAQKRQIAVDSCTGTAQLILQPRHRDRVACRFEQAMQGVDAFVAVHASIMSESLRGGVSIAM